MAAALRGHFVWHELMTPDVKSGAGFFTKIVGWKTKQWNGSYMLFTFGGRQMAGLMDQPEDARRMGAPPSWLSYIATPDVDATAKQAVSLGGTVLKEPTDIPTVGRFAVIRDPQGAVFAAFRGLQDMTPDATPGLGDFSWHELATTDWRAALAFYQALFGWEATDSMDMGPAGTYQMFGWKGQTLGGIFNKPAEQPGPPAWLAYIKVADARKAAETIKKLGGRVLNGPMEVPGGDLIVQGLDRQGGAFAVHSSKPAVKSAGAAKGARPAAAKKQVAKKKPASKAAPRKATKARKSAPGRRSIKRPTKRASSKKRATRGRRR
jgi:hypothetical protein